MDKKKKIIIISIISVVAVVIVAVLGIAILGNNGEGFNKEGTSQSETSKYSWPNLTEHNIPNLEKGLITELVDECNKNEYELNYVINVKNIKKSDIVDYSKKFESNWSVYESDNTTLIIAVTSTTKYSIFIDVNEENETAKFTITSMK